MLEVRSLLRAARPRRATLLIGLLAGIAACSGQSCSCIQPIKGGFPVAQRRANGVQARLTKSFLQYVSDNATAIVPGLIPTGTTFNVPPSCDATASYEFCCGMPQPMCRLSFDPRGLVLTPAPPGSLHFDSQIIVKTLDIIPVKTSFGSCNVSIDTTRSGSTTMRAQGDITLPIDSNTKLVGLGLSNATIANIDAGDVNLDEAGSDSICTLANVSLIKDFIISYVSGQVGTLVAGVVEQQLCESCNAVSDCSATATACTTGKCIGPDGKGCLQLLGIEGRAKVGTFVSSFSPHSPASIDLMEAAGGFVTADTGLSLGVLGGSLADPHSSCVPAGVAPAAVEVAPSASFQGDVVPGTTTPYHVGLGIHISHLAGLLFSYWDAGGLCWQIEGENIAQLSASTLQIIMPSITQLLHTADAPMRIVFRPTTQPTLTLGKGTFKTVGSIKVVDDPLITIFAKDLAADFYLLIDDRYVRVTTLTADMQLPLGLDSDGTGAITLVAGAGDKSFVNLRISNSELLTETKAELEAAAPTLIGVALSNTLAYLGKFTLPTLAGIVLHPKVITSSDPDTHGAPQFVAVYSDVKAPNTITRSTETTARVVSLFTPPTEVFSVVHRDGRVPSVTVEVAGGDDGRAYEWSWAFDNGMWHPYQTSSQLKLTDEVLWLQGRHVVSVRARVVGDPSSVDPSPVDLVFFIDSEAPSGTFRFDGKQLQPDANDRISPKEALRYRVGSVGDFITAAELAKVPVTGAVESLDLEVRDEAGNVARLAYVTPVFPAAHGCDLAPGSHGDTGVLTLLCIALLVLVSRRRYALALLLPLLGCHHGVSDGDKLDPSDPIGRKHDVQLRSGVIHVAAYDEKVGDLGYGTISSNNLGATIDWVLVDGDDPSAAADATTSFRHGHTAPGPDVGYYNALALSASGDPRIAYFDATSHAVKLASGPFPFSSHVVDQGSADGLIEVGQFPAITVDITDRPLIAYSAVGLGDGSGYRSELRVARAKSSTPASAADWDMSLVDSAAISCGGRCGVGFACITKPMVANKPNNNPAYSSCVAIDLAPCAIACTAGLVCIAGVCTANIVAPKVGDLPQGTGLYTEFISGPSGKLSLAYYDRSNGELRLAQQGAVGKFLAATIDGGVAGTDVGAFTSGAYVADTLNLAYVDSVSSQLTFRTVSTAGVPSASAVIDDGMRTDGIHPVGASASLRAIDGGLLVLYQDQATSDVELARYNGTWTRSTLRASATEGSGFSSHLMVDGTGHFYSTWTFDRSAARLGSLVFGAVP